MKSHSLSLLLLSIVLSFFLTACDKTDDFVDVPHGQAGYVTVGNYTVKVSVPSDSGDDILYDVRTGDIEGQVIIDAISIKAWPLNCIASNLKVEKISPKSSKVRTFAISGIQSDTEIMLVYAPAYTVSVQANNGEYGSVSGSGVYPEESGVELSAKAADGFAFSAWVDDKGDLVSTDNPLILDSLSSNISLTAVFILTSIEGVMVPVDLGLSVMWAACNVGAKNEADRGDYFSWGEIAAKETYSEASYTLAGQYQDSATLLSLENDAAYKNLKVPAMTEKPLPEGWVWRTPTPAELLELMEKCKMESMEREDSEGNTVKGLLFTNVESNVSIFIPVNGFYGSAGVNFYDTDGNYWTSERPEEDGKKAYSFGFNPSGNLYSAIEQMPRYAGLCIRPVFGPPVSQ